MTADGHLQYQVHRSKPVPFSSPEKAPIGEPQMFQYIATTLISGEREAVLVDPPIDETRAYLEDAQRLSQTSHSALEFYNAMMERYPARLNPTALWFWGAQVQCPPAGASQSG